MERIEGVGTPVAVVSLKEDGTEAVTPADDVCALVERIMGEGGAGDVAAGVQEGLGELVAVVCEAEDGTRSRVALEEFNGAASRQLAHMIARGLAGAMAQDGEGELEGGPSTARAVRERLGLTEGDVALFCRTQLAMGVTALDVKLWEDPSADPDGDAVADGIEVLGVIEGAEEAMAARLADELWAMAEEDGDPASSLAHIGQYKSQEELDRLCPDAGGIPHRLANRVMADAGRELRRRGMAVAYDPAGPGAVPFPFSCHLAERDGGGA